MTLGDYIKEYRQAHKYSMDDFAKLIGRSKAYVSILERNFNPSTGKAAIPSIETIKRVAIATGIGFNELFALLDEDQQVSLVPESQTSDAPLPPNIIPMPKMRKIPLVGTIACGEPILAQENIEEYISIPKDLAGDFALTCRGDSMINARIFDGDIVYIRQQDTVDSGEIAAVLIDGEATLKRVRIFEDHISLEPENPMYKPFVYWNEEMNSVRILGKAVAFTSVIQ